MMRSIYPVISYKWTQIHKDIHNFLYSDQPFLSYRFPSRCTYSHVSITYILCFTPFNFVRCWPKTVGSCRRNILFQGTYIKDFPKLAQKPIWQKLYLSLIIFASSIFSLTEQVWTSLTCTAAEATVILQRIFNEDNFHSILYHKEEFFSFFSC